LLEKWMQCVLVGAKQLHLFETRNWRSGALSGGATLVAPMALSVPLGALQQKLAQMIYAPDQLI
tara:strand:+ start:219 stop:410 length:192 start_codon:yes stop_codon:yes gene_type:complete